MRIGSPDFTDGGNVPKKFTCDGEDAIPRLAFDGVPKSAKSLVLIVDDPDAPVGTWDHWILFNIPPEACGIDGAEKEPPWPHGKNSWLRTSWNGPCPPDREHRYFFSLYALGQTLNLKDGVDKQTLLRAMEGHVIEKAELVGKYKRPWM
jgi:Raf kinase inhibitor-like YbhB/YbcL family protein